MLTCINIIWPATGLGAGASRRTTGVEDIINRTLHLTVIYRLTLIRATERDRQTERLFNAPVIDSCRQEERNTEKEQRYRRLWQTEYLRGRLAYSSTSDLQRQKNDRQGEKQKEGQKGERDRSNFHWRETKTGTNSRFMGVCVHLVDGGEASDRLPSATWLIL